MKNILEKTYSPRYLVYLLFFLLLVGYSYTINFISTGTLLDTDFGKFYNTSQLYFSGKNIYSGYVDINLLRAHPKVKNYHRAHVTNLNPPLLVMLMLPLGKLNYNHALILWSLLSIVLGAISVIFILHEYHITLARKPTLFLLIVASFFLYAPTSISIFAGQVELLLFPILILSWLMLRRTHLFMAGFLLGFAFSLKIFFGLFVVWLLLRCEWRAVTGFFVAILCAFLLTSWIFGIDVYWRYYQVFSEITWYSSTWNVSLYGFLVRFFGSPVENNTPILPLPWLAQSLYYLLSVTIILGMMWVVWFKKTNISFNKQLDLEFSYVIVAMLLISPLGWIYYLPTLFLPFIAIWFWANESNYRNGLWLVLFVVIFLSGVPQNLFLPSQIVQPITVWFWASLAVYAQFLLLIMLVFLAKTDKENQSIVPISPATQLLVYLSSLFPSLVGLIKIVASVSGGVWKVI